MRKNLKAPALNPRGCLMLYLAFHASSLQMLQAGAPAYVVLERCSLTLTEPAATMVPGDDGTAHPACDSALRGPT